MLSDFMDSMLTGGRGSNNDSRFKFSVGDRVVIHLQPYQYERFGEENNGAVGVVKSRRNAYPPPAFEGYWLPIYYVDLIGEIGENCLELEA